MKTLLSQPTHKLVLWTSVLLLTYIALYELWLTSPDNPACCWTVYKAGVIASRVAYSILAASVFYLVTQYLGTYVPRQRKKMKIILPYVHRQTAMLDTILHNLRFELNILTIDFRDSDNFRNALQKIKVDEPVGGFANWHQYLYNMKFEILSLIRGMYFYSEYLSEDFLHEVVLIEQRLMYPVTFAGYKKLACTDLSYANLDLQEILIHNAHLQTITASEAEKYKKAFEGSGLAYRKKYYSDHDAKHSS